LEGCGDDTDSINDRDSFFALFGSFLLQIALELLFVTLWIDIVAFTDLF
jgi:hypothetical protein